MPLVAATLVFWGKEGMLREMLYPAPPVAVPAMAPAPLQAVELEIGGGVQVVAWSYERPGSDVKTPAVVFFHGNGENLETLRAAGLYDQLAELGVHFLAVDYPGYGRSGGSPSETSLLATGQAGFTWLAARYPESPKVILGWSLGAAVAVATAAAVAGEADGLAVFSAWDDLPSVAATHFPRWLVRLVVNERYDSYTAAMAVKCPVLLIHGSEDQIIPIERGRRLHTAFGPEARWVEVPYAGHNNLLAMTQLWAETGELLNLVASRR